MVVKYGIWIVLTTTVLMLCGIIPSGESLAVVSEKVRYTYSSILSLNMLLSKYSITSINIKVGKIKNLIWDGGSLLI